MNILLGEQCLEIHPQAYDIFCLSRISNTWSFDNFSKSLSGPYSYISADEGRAVTGFVIANPVLDELEIEDICISSRHRNCGIASALLHNLITKAQANKMTRILLEVAETNTPALALYRKFNFNQDGVRKHYYKPDNQRAIDAILMSLKLD